MRRCPKAANYGLTTEDCGPTAIANRRLIADWETNCGFRTHYGSRTNYASTFRL
jgi:hypothetical protein